MSILKAASYYFLIALGMDKDTALRLLNLPENFSAEDLKKTYKQKAFELHPDRNPSPTANKDLLEVNEAYQTLTNLPKEIELEEDPYPSYEEIAQMRKDMGREEFNKRFPDWEMELKSEMGLDEYNRIFEGYDPHYEPSYEDQQRLWDSIEGLAGDEADNIINLAKENNDLNLYSNVNDLIKKYLNKDLSIFKNHSERVVSEFKKLLAETLKEKILDAADEFDITLQDVLDFPHHKVVQAYIEQSNNLEFPDKLLENKDFVKGGLLLLDNYTPYKKALGKAFFNKYKNNVVFLTTIADSAKDFWWLKNHPEIKEQLLNSSLLSEEQLKNIKRWITREN